MTGRGLALIDDRIVPEAEAQIFWNDPGFRRGYGVFETIRIANGRAFLAGCHALRLEAGARALGIDPWIHPRTLVRRLERLTAENEMIDGVVRVFLTPGASPPGQAPAVPASISGGISAGAPGGILFRGLGGSSASSVPGALSMDTAVRARSRYLATVSSREPTPPTARATLAPHLRDSRAPLVGIKTLSYAEEQLLLARARAAGFDESLRRNLAGRISEGTWSSVFLIEGTTLVTPPTSEGLLAGITRWFVLRTAGDSGFEPLEEPVTVERLQTADEAFLTSTTRGIVPLLGLDHGSIGGGVPGARTERLARILERHVTRGRFS